MKILLVQPNNRSHVIMPSLGLGYLAAVLRHSGHDVAILNCLLEGLLPQAFGKRVSEIAPEIIGFQLFSYDLNVIKGYLCAARKALTNVTMIAGGAHPSGDPEGTLNYLADLDYAFKGEAEIGLPLLMRYLQGESLSPADIPGLIRRADGGRISVTPPAYVHDLDSLPLPAWDLLKPTIYPQAPHGAFTRRFPTAPIIVTRGCPGKCTFCSGKSITGSKIRKRSIGNVIVELRLLQNLGIKEFHIEDENFTAHRKLVLEFCDRLNREKLNITWSLPSGVRIDSLDREMLERMEQAGCYSLGLGIEFGSQKMMDLTCKNLSLELVRQKLGLFRGLNIKTTGFFLFNIPGETMEEMKKTVEFALELPLDRAQFNNFMPLPGSALWDQLKRQGELDEINWDRFFIHDVAYAAPGISHREIKRLSRSALLRFYLRPRILWGLLSEIRSWRHFTFLVRRFIDSMK